MRFSHLEKIQGLALVGATGLVGREFLEILDDYKVKIPRIRLLASERSSGETIEHQGGPQIVDVLTPESFEGSEIAFFSVPKEISKKYIPYALDAGCTVIDDSDLYRMDPGVPLTVPQINGAELKDFEGKIIATPNCSTTPVAMVLKPLMEVYGLERVVVSTYQSVSGAGSKAMQELSEQTIQLMNGKTTTNEVFPHRIAFNCIPQIGSILENGNSSEEEKVVKELRKILDLPDLRVSSTAVRVPTFSSHGISVNVEFKKEFGSIEEIRELLEKFPAVKVVDQPEHQIYPTNMDATKGNETLVGRIRRDSSVKSGLNFWVIADNLRKGAALNVLESLEVLYAYRSLN